MTRIDTGPEGSVGAKYWFARSERYPRGAAQPVSWRGWATVAILDYGVGLVAMLGVMMTLARENVLAGILAGAAVGGAGLLGAHLVKRRTTDPHRTAEDYGQGRRAVWRPRIGAARRALDDARQRRDSMEE